MIEVLKFGSSVLRGPEDVHRVARVVARRAREGFRPVVVVSAMGDTTDYLLDLARQVSKNPKGRELDMLLTAGERTSMALVAMALEDLGLRAASFTGSQVGIITDTNFGKARIREVRLYRIREAIEEGVIPVVAGFQGVSITKDVTTLGRGGSDLTAVALAVAFGGVPVRFYKGSGGVLTGDPRWLPGAKPIGWLSYELALEASWLGAKVIAHRALALASKHGLSLWVLGLEKEGTEIGQFMEEPGPRLVTLRRVVLVKEPAESLLKKGVEVLAWIEGCSVVPEGEAPGEPAALVSVIGEGVDGLASRVLALLPDVKGLLVSPRAVSALVPAEAAEEAAGRLAREFGLTDEKPS